MKTTNLTRKQIARARRIARQFSGKMRTQVFKSLLAGYKDQNPLGREPW